MSTGPLSPDPARVAAILADRRAVAGAQADTIEEALSVARGLADELLWQEIELTRAIDEIGARHVSALLSMGRGSALFLNPLTGRLVFAAEVRDAVTVVATHADISRMLAGAHAARGEGDGLPDPDAVARAVRLDARRRLLAAAAGPTAADIEAAMLEVEVEQEVERLREDSVRSIAAMLAERPAPPAPVLSPSGAPPTEDEVQAELERLRANARADVVVLLAARESWWAAA